jgi:hypothetical protein
MLQQKWKQQQYNTIKCNRDSFTFYLTLPIHESSYNSKLHCLHPERVLSRVSIARGCRARQARSFLCLCLITVFLSSIEARQPRVAVDRRCSSDTRPSQLKEHSTLKSLCRGTKNHSDLARHAPSSRAAVFLLPRSNMVSTLRSKATNIASRNRYPALH